MSVCTFFGHRECWGLDGEVLRGAVEGLILEGVDVFLVGHQGQFDGMVYSCLQGLRQRYPHIRCAVVLAYMPGKGEAWEDTMYPEGLETVHPKYAIGVRNRFLISQADVCICYVNHTWGGAFRYAQLAKRKGLRVINLGCASL